MREKYDEELRKLNISIINMGKMIEIAIESSMLALMGRDVEAAKQAGTFSDSVTAVILAGFFQIEEVLIPKINFSPANGFV